MMNKYEIIKGIIDEFDYYGLLAAGAPKDEFDSYSHEYADVISETDTVEQIATLIAKTMDKAFGEEVEPEKYMQTAERIHAALKSKW